MVEQKTPNYWSPLNISQGSVATPNLHFTRNLTRSRRNFSYEYLVYMKTIYACDVARLA